MSGYNEPRIADILENEDDDNSVSTTTSTRQMNTDRNQFQVQIVVTPSRGRDGGAEIKVCGPNGSIGGGNSPQVSRGRSASRRLPPIHNSQESQWISRRTRTPSPAIHGRQDRYYLEPRYGRHHRNRNDSDGVTQFLRSNPDFLDRFVMEEIELEQLERWIIRRSQKMKKKHEQKNDRKISLSKWKFCVHADKRKMLQDLTTSLEKQPTKDEVLWELASCISSAVDADGFQLILIENADLSRTSIFKGNIKTSLKASKAVIAYVIDKLESVRVSYHQMDSRFPNGSFKDGEEYHVMCQPVVSNGKLAAILELWKIKGKQPFHEEDEEIGMSYLVWGGIALHYADLYFSMNQQKKLNDFLLDVVKSIFQDMISIDKLVKKIMNFAQKLVDADRASLFLVDTKNNQLYATIFDVGLDEEERVEATSKEIRFPLGIGIAGIVATTGEILNISDAYSDVRFNRSIDQLTGYKTDTILCMPIYIQGRIIGVVQMVNKHTGMFTKEDQDAFEMFAIYCGLALHHAQLYDQIKKSEQKYRVALEVLSYHNTCNEEEFKEALGNGIPEKIIGVDDYYFNPFGLKDNEKAKHAIYMFIDLFGLTRFDKNSLIRFTLTVRKNYRRVPYHNWTHGFSVANSMYTIIKHSNNIFSLNESLALYIGALCHDLDHRGKTNKFMLDTASPLANIYSTSTMEHHHFNQTVTILQQEGHNIFSKLSSTEYKEVLDLLKHCILATDLALFFNNKDRLSKILSEDNFSWHNQDHRLLIQAIAMTGSDLSASAKPWEVQVKTVDIIFQEFYDQGDEEKKNGRTPLPMMDRNQTNHQPASQVGFLTGICSPCYTLLHQLIPETKSLLDMCHENLRRWKDIDDNIKEKREAR
ncbi:PREDICTED: probable 3',5'-cyclic phosphodiesterase pde-5 isoform X2 [Nicrophorus vespilloides]|uniref:Phosphodiesterase n=1 Tax=Nicrophorus vespilloides TaxID=110193 RepID=A0ABM1MK54_NICVS|nr:PREDICTED: probable 3',5'-cyclic phosphodiesterase pde-5 isoform X2 [Nicrophorus vespilloides]